MQRLKVLGNIYQTMAKSLGMIVRPQYHQRALAPSSSDTRMGTCAHSREM